MFSCLIIFSIVSLGLVDHVSARLISAVILPHGDTAVDPFLVPDAFEAALQVFLGAHMVALSISTKKILLLTHHGLSLPHDFGVYIGSRATGTFAIGSDEGLAERNLSASALLEHDLVTILVKGVNISGISAPGSSSLPLYWAEVTPLLLMAKTGNEVAIMSMPSRRYNGIPTMELVQLGTLLRDVLEQDNNDWTVLVSGDFSHTHRNDGPYGFDIASSIYDDEIGLWASQPYNYSLQRAENLQPRAMSCGNTGFQILRSIMCCRVLYSRSIGV